MNLNSHMTGSPTKDNENGLYGVCCYVICRTADEPTYDISIYNCAYVVSVYIHRYALHNQVSNSHSLHVYRNLTCRILLQQKMQQHPQNLCRQVFRLCHIYRNHHLHHHKYYHHPISHSLFLPRSFCTLNSAFKPSDPSLQPLQPAASEHNTPNQNASSPLLEHLGERGLMEAVTGYRLGGFLFFFFSNSPCFFK